MLHECDQLIETLSSNKIQEHINWIIFCHPVKTQSYIRTSSIMFLFYWTHYIVIVYISTYSNGSWGTGLRKGDISQVLALLEERLESTQNTRKTHKLWFSPSRPSTMFIRMLGRHGLEAVANSICSDVVSWWFAYATRSCAVSIHCAICCRSCLCRKYLSRLGRCCWRVYNSVRAAHQKGGRLGSNCVGSVDESGGRIGLCGWWKIRQFCRITSGRSRSCRVGSVWCQEGTCAIDESRFGLHRLGKSLHCCCIGSRRSGSRRVGSMRYQGGTCTFGKSRTWLCGWGKSRQCHHIGIRRCWRRGVRSMQYQQSTCGVDESRIWLCGMGKSQ